MHGSAADGTDMGDVCAGGIFQRYFKYYFTDYTGGILGDPVGVGSGQPAAGVLDSSQIKPDVLYLRGIPGDIFRECLVLGASGADAVFLVVYICAAVCGGICFL